MIERFSRRLTVDPKPNRPGNRHRGMADIEFTKIILADAARDAVAESDKLALIVMNYLEGSDK